MAKSFWSKRKENVQAANSYVKDASSVSRPAAILLTVLGILIVGGLLFGVFSGTRWIISQVNKDDTETVSTTDDTPAPAAPQPTTPSTGTNSTNSGNVTATTSTTTTTPSPNTTQVASATAPAASSSALPNTGPGSYLSIFLAVAVLGYLAHYTRTLRKNQ